MNLCLNIVLASIIILLAIFVLWFLVSSFFITLHHMCEEDCNMYDSEAEDNYFDKDKPKT
ncbi:hypothetical protein SAMN02745196_01443 [Clostridium collagenovorans DSM 3089]|uniref:Uncharacterized protein n=1 Tax=Clostridium collagenovorans DSM 3089 TaxID=1121306 RepID=A0A1M5VYS3_9CLOT|nr:hypothetical protein [Clostridium collagenovorans]SHH80330.1 hypothetical protein SAMN02745196_01443 [Clostridium collagenovorans DSM 3089]